MVEGKKAVERERWTVGQLGAGSWRTQGRKSSQDWRYAGQRYLGEQSLTAKRKRELGCRGAEFVFLGRCGIGL